MRAREYKCTTGIGTRLPDFLISSRYILYHRTSIQRHMAVSHHEFNFSSMVILVDSHQVILVIQLGLYLGVHTRPVGRMLPGWRILVKSAVLQCWNVCRFNCSSYPGTHLLHISGIFFFWSMLLVFFFFFFYLPLKLQNWLHTILLLSTSFRLNKLKEK